MIRTKELLLLRPVKRDMIALFNFQLLFISCDENGGTPLHKVTKEGHYSTVQFLISEGVVVNSCDGNGRTPLQKTSLGGPASFVQFYYVKKPTLIHAMRKEKLLFKHLFSQPVKRKMYALCKFY